jgi:hypothetical protein
MGLDKDAVARETANKLAKLFIARRDVKAIQRATHDGEWMCVKKPLDLDDFKKHLFDKDNCLGTYLLDKKSRVKFVAFDIDLTGSGPYFVIRDIDANDDDAMVALEAEYAAAGEMDLDYRVGPWEATLHDPQNEGFRWVRSHLRVLIESLCDRVEAQLGLPAMPVVTGGGAHVLVPFGERIPAADGRAAAHGVMASIAASEPSSLPFWRTSENFYSNAPTAERDEQKRLIGETITIEVFPKQDSLPSPDSFGNLIRLPFGWHGEAGIRTYVMKREPNLLPPWELPKENGVTALDAAIARLGLTAEAND